MKSKQTNEMNLWKFYHFFLRVWVYDQYEFKSFDWHLDIYVRQSEKIFVL